MLVNEVVSGIVGIGNVAGNLLLGNGMGSEGKWLGKGISGLESATVPKDGFRIETCRGSRFQASGLEPLSLQPVP
jgi:hypothetical protein